MKRKAFTISIPEPCSANWADMTSVDKGRFCQQCSKTVIDFSTKSDAEVIRLFQQTEGSLCGRFKNQQLERPIYDLPNEKSRKPLRWIAGLLFWANADRISAQVQDPSPILDSLSTKDFKWNPNAGQDLGASQDSVPEQAQQVDSLEADSLDTKLEINLSEYNIPNINMPELRTIMVTVGGIVSSGFCAMEPIQRSGSYPFPLIPEKLSKILFPGQKKLVPETQISKQDGNSNSSKAIKRTKSQSTFLVILKYILLITPIALLLTYFRVRKQKKLTDTEEPSDKSF